MNNLFADLPARIHEELVTVLVERSGIRVERIVSCGQASPDGFWYDQDQHEWVALLKGEAMLEFEDDEPMLMKLGDHILIPAHRRHRVQWTTPKESTVWLAVFYSD